MDADKKIKSTLLKCIPLAVLALAIPLLAICSFLKPETEELGTWFQRSGSIAVFFAVWIEYSLFQINDLINPTGIITENGDRFGKKYGGYFNFFKSAGVTLALWGTVIWGYGDLLFK